MHSEKVRLSRKIAFFYSVVTFAILFSSLLLVKNLAIRYSLSNYSSTISKEIIHPLEAMLSGGRAKMTKLFQEYTIIYGKEFLSDPYELKGKIKMPENYPFMEEIDGIPYVFVKVGKINSGEIYAISPAYQLQSLESALSYLTILLSIVGAVVVVTIGMIFSAAMLRPLKKLSKTLRRIEDLKTYQELPEQKHKEFQELVDSLNSMLSRLKSGFERQEQFVSDASHELRTPLAALSANLDMLLRWGVNDKEVLINSLNDMKISVERLKKLVSSLLELSRGDAKIEKKELDLVKIAQEIVKEARSLYPDFEIEIDGKGHAFSEEEKVKEIIRIFVDNAFKYSGTRKKIIIHVADGKISVEDFGIGISQQDVKHIFDRFYRADNSRTGLGFGLGLSIAKKLSDLIGARISVTSSVGKGSVFTLELY